jgi:broad specificity phosphatase PhoE
VIEQLILVRHGETVHNVDGIAQGWNDSALSLRGQEQVRRLAERLAPLGVDALFSSPLDRALSTARAIAGVTGLEIGVLKELREMNYGGWEGRSFLEVRHEDDETYRRWMVDADAPCPRGESHNDVRQRLEQAFANIGVSQAQLRQMAGSQGSSLTNGAKRVVVVTHGTAIRVAATALLELPVMASRHFAQDNASMNVFAWRGDRYVLKSWNDTTHCF